MSHAEAMPCGEHARPLPTGLPAWNFETDTTLLRVLARNAAPSAARRRCARRTSASGSRPAGSRRWTPCACAAGLDALGFGPGMGCWCWVTTGRACTWACWPPVRWAVTRCRSTPTPRPTSCATSRRSCGACGAGRRPGTGRQGAGPARQRRRHRPRGLRRPAWHGPLPGAGPAVLGRAAGRGPQAPERRTRAAPVAAGPRRGGRSGGAGALVGHHRASPRVCR
jgi:hypothetical protein